LIPGHGTVWCPAVRGASVGKATALAVPSRASRYGRHAASPKRRAPAHRSPGEQQARSVTRRAPAAAPVAAFLAVLVVAAGGAWAVGSRDPGGPDASREAALFTSSPSAEPAPSRPATDGTDQVSRDKRTVPGAPSLRPLEPTTTAPRATASTVERSAAPAPAATTRRPTGPAPTSSPAPAPTTTATSSAGATEIEAEVTRLTNVERAKAGCGALRIDARLTTAARLHSQDMVDRGYFSHTSPDGEGPGDRAEAAGYPSWSGENIAAGYPTPTAVVRGWMSSDGHRANILNCSSKATGVGYDPREDIWTQMFGLE
jgi:uncharacterized protein YkwD